MDKKAIQARLDAAFSVSKAPAVPAVDFDIPSFGIKETKEVFDFAFDFAEAGDKALEDGRLTLGDIPDSLKPLRSILPAINGIKMVVDELLDLDAQERIELENHASAKLGAFVAIDELHDIITDAISLSLGLITLGSKINSFRKRDEETA